MNFKLVPKILIITLTALLAILVSSVKCYASSAGIDDKAGLYTKEQLETLEARQQEVADYTGWNIAVVTTNEGFGEDGYSAINYAEYYYETTFDEFTSGILYLIDIDYRYFFVSGEADYKYFSDARVKAMSKKCEKYYYDYDDVGNLNAFYDYVVEVYDKGPFTASEKVMGNVLYGFRGDIGFIVGAIAAVIGVAVVLSRYKFKEKVSANIYLDRSRTSFYRRNDRFVREFTTKARIDSDGGSHGGGGGESHHGSSGGHSHGGGGHGGRR
jgi:uncharacterized protein